MAKYLVTGRFEGKKVKEKVEAASKEQAKLKAGFNSGFGGNMLTPFIKSRKVKVIKIK